MTEVAGSSNPCDELQRLVDVVASAPSIDGERLPILIQLRTLQKLLGRRPDETIASETPAPTRERLLDLATELARYFTSGNPVLVERATIRRESDLYLLLRECMPAWEFERPAVKASAKPREWLFDRYRDGRLKAQGVRVHAVTEEEAWEKARSLLDIDGNKPSDELRLAESG